MFFTAVNALWMWFVLGKAELLSWRGVLDVVIPSALSFLIMMWLTPPMKPSENEDED
ncbi:hypothetical protein BANAN_00170 [Bifidobacterium animalis subsp. animalis ATCC 25527]|nr:hypothetical protein BANAN_00170 [Bifidobacterium animalis subsp. animalis ATCC 25527]